MKNAIETDKLSRFPAGTGPEHVLSDVNLEIPVGARVGLLGGNGAGKTTLIKLLLGLAPIGDGRAYLFERPVPVEESRVNVGYLPEQAMPFDYLTGREHLELFGRLENLEGDELDRKIKEGLSAMGLSHAGNLPTRYYSKGMRQKLELARLMLTPKKLLFLDEPLTGLDTESQLAFEDRLHEQAKAGVTMVITSHEPRILEEICSHFAVLRKGRLVSFGTREEILGERGWCITFDPGSKIPAHDSERARILEREHGLLYKDRDQAEKALASFLENGEKILGFGTLLKSVSDILREIVEEQ